MGLSDGVVRDGALRSSSSGLELSVRVGWYRSLPLSSVLIESLSFDGRPVPLSSVVFELDGTSYTVDELPALYDKWWFVQDAAVLRVPDISYKTGSTVRVDLAIGWRIPYIIIGPETALLQRAHVLTDLEVTA